jgi:hypothetical protein
MRSVVTDDMREAAMTFAGRIARRNYGRRGVVRVLRQDCTNQDCTLAEYEAFVGLTDRQNQTTGHNIRFTVHA